MSSSLRALALVLSLALALAAIACRRAEQPPCPGNTAPDDRRARALVALLDGTPEGGALVRRLGARAPRLCFGEVAVSSITTTGIALLDAQLGDPEAAARLGHLMQHAERGAPGEARDGGGGGCDAEVARALADEAGALALELRLRDALGVTAPRVVYEFEGAFRRAAPEDREAIVLGYLEAHPRGGPGIDALGEGYMRRCRERAR